MQGTEEGQAATKSYVALGKSMREFENRLYKAWVATIDPLALSLLKRPILKSPESGKLVVNFGQELVQLIRETKYLDRLGFTVPEVALNVALQEEKFHQFVGSLQQMCDLMLNVRQSIDPALHKLVAHKVLELEDVLKPGLTAYNWNSLGIQVILCILF